MTQAYLHPETEVADPEVRESIRAMKRARAAKLTLVLIATIAGIAVLVIGAYVGLT